MDRCLAEDDQVERVARAIAYADWKGMTDGYNPWAQAAIAALDPDFAAAHEAGRRERDAEVAVLREALQECADDLEAFIDNDYGATPKVYPTIARRYERDMQPVRAARAALAAAPGPGGEVVCDG